jgi:hypothetical protein
MIDCRAAFGAALGFLALEPCEPELRLLHRCFDTWRGIGHACDRFEKFCMGQRAGAKSVFSGLASSAAPAPSEP